ncbi:MAG: hypothetical protein E7157_02075 [Lactobacillales bacterium]|nr:hypothetical protein [Lactobacillales bacterium]
MYSKSEIIVNRIFKEVKDKGNNPYLDHLYYVSNNLDNENMKIVGLLHDLLEDTEITELDLIEIGFTKDIIEALLLVTRKEESYAEFIDKIISSNNKIALYVKKVDLENNMDLSRIKNPTVKDYERVENKYKPNYQKILNKIKEMER